MSAHSGESKNVLQSAYVTFNIKI